MCASGQQLRYLEELVKLDRGVQKVTLKMINENIAKHKLQVADQSDAASNCGHSGWAHRHVSLYNTLNACDGLVAKLRNHELSKSSADGRAWPAKTKSSIALTKLATEPEEVAFLMHTLLHGDRTEQRFWEN